MDCPTEEALIRNKLGGLATVSGMEFNLMQRVLTVVHKNNTLAVVETAIRDLGMSTEPMETSSQGSAPTEAVSKPWWPLALAGLAALGAEIVHWLGLPEWLSGLLALVAITISGIGTFKKGWIALRHGNLNINALMSIAVTGAVLLRQWPEAAMVMVLFTLAELIEAKSLDRARNAIRGLLQLTPEMATVQQADGDWVELPAKAVAIGQIVRVKPGERVALDGVVTAGRSSINQAPITGESLPVDKSAGDSVFAGTINQSGAVEFRVTAESTHSTLARIIHAVEEAQGARAPTQRFVDQFAKIYTPAVFVFAIAVALVPPLLFGGDWQDWVYQALVLLVIACPCALVISTPITIVSGLAAAARHGILIKGGVYLEEGHKLAWLAFDKTGTITHGKPVLTDTVLLDQTTGVDAVRVATSLAARSDHPVSHAIATSGQQNGTVLLEVADFAAIPGRGVLGTVGGVSYQLGNHRLIHELGVCTPLLEASLGELEEQGKTVILLTDGERVLVLFAVADTVKDSSRAAIRALHELGIKTVMLTGDNAHTARAIAAQVQIDAALGDQLPEDKLRAIEGYAQRGKVGMVGDGINDAPALARADIGFAMGAAGTDTAIETADVALMDDDLNKIARFVRLSRTTRTVLIQNITLALGIKAVFLVLTLLGMGTMWMAVFADMGASLLVVANALRLVRQ
ncbi:MAG TPA: heavy metal translocating P-type ATPase [Accumulibacter sp.]|jgi:Cd2+/Zn2+-exporting ATPase|uniref:heavy metal translocating P-type ATPase n=1 Tax=Accumulibacter sp. TaxID=2053492 RepID=UPI00044E1091|nr:heavy metal translocating P-type ATPase [Accumulibacter sp.]HRE71559.1 heavy metal translocating P-type ATPase [Accumulibacter sp.]HRL74688.1 heavy metal translocating P-type ATPase [Candidatus Accumulibacter phosphatis]